MYRNFHFKSRRWVNKPLGELHIQTAALSQPGSFLLLGADCCALTWAPEALAAPV